MSLPNSGGQFESDYPLMKKEKRGILICACAEQDLNCHLMCPKARKIDPDYTIRVKTWKKKVQYNGTYS